MRKVINENTILSGLLCAVLDSAALFAATKLGLEGWTALAAVLLVSILLSGYLSALVTRMCNVSKEFAAIATGSVLVCAGGLLWKFGDYNVWTNLPMYILPGILISVLSLIIAKIRIRKTTQKIYKLFEATNGHLVVDRDEAVKLMDEMKGENRQITGEYNKKNAAVCENGIFVGKNSSLTVTEYKGIPYALPPVGNLRWKPPVSVLPSNKVYEAYYYGRTQPQPYTNHTQASLYYTGEDCLTLNIWISRLAGEKCPVIVCLDTFDWCTGGTASLISDGADFVRENPEVIFVNINFRLGLFANMDFSSLPGGEEYRDAHNLGLLDQIEALKWIRRNIQSFRGDPDNITLLGFTGGGCGAILLAASPKAKGLFRQVVCMGGTTFLTNDTDTFKKCSRQVCEYFKAHTMEDMLALSPEQLSDAIYKINCSYIALPVRDGDIVPEDIKESFRRGNASDTGIIISISTQEGLLTGTFGQETGELKADYAEYLKNAMNLLDADEKKALYDYMKKYYGTGSDEAFCNEELITDLLCHYPMFNICREHSEAGGNSRYIVWNIKSPVRNIGASSLVSAIIMLAKDKYGEYCGVTGDPLMFRAIRRMLVNYSREGDPSLKIGEINNISEIPWPSYSDTTGEVMVVNEYGFENDKGALSHKLKDLHMMHKVLL